MGLAERLGLDRLVDTIKGDTIGVISPNVTPVNEDEPEVDEVADLNRRIGLLEAKLKRRDATIDRLKERLSKVRKVTVVKKKTLKKRK